MGQKGQTPNDPFFNWDDQGLSLIDPNFSGTRQILFDPELKRYP